MNKSTRYFLPLFLITLGVMLLAGCIWLPIPEHASTSAETDPRPLLKGKQPKIVIGTTTRAQLVEMLGVPSMASDDRRAVVYTYTTEWGAWISICFQAAPSNSRCVLLGVLFDDRDIVADLDLTNKTYGYGPVNVDYITRQPCDLVDGMKPSIRSKFCPKPIPDEPVSTTRPCTQP